MAGETANPPEKPTAGSRTTPVLVPQGDFAGKPDLPLDRPVTTVGSRHTNRLHLLSRSVSKAHAIVVHSNGTTYISDLASRAGVIVNGKAVQQAELKTGDRVQIGKFLFRFRTPKPAAPIEAPTEAPAAALDREGDSPTAITDRVLLIGRREGAGVALKRDADVSASHAVIFAMNGDWYARDLGSRTGTRVNGKTIHQQKLQFGDRIEVGKSTFAFAPGSATAAPGGVPDIADMGLELDESPQSSRIPLAVDSVAAEPAIEPPAEPAAEEVAKADDPFAAPAAEDLGLDFEPEPTATEAAADAPGLEPVEIDKNETLIPLDADDVAELDLSAEPTAEAPVEHEQPAPAAPVEEPGRLMVDVDLHAPDRLSSSGTHADLQREAEEALAEARADSVQPPADIDSPLAATPADAHIEDVEELDALDLAPIEEAEEQAPEPVRPTTPESHRPAVVEPQESDELTLDDLQAEVTPRRGWRASLTADQIPLDETPSPQVPAAPLEPAEAEGIEEPHDGVPEALPLAEAPVSEAASAPLPAPVESERDSAVDAFTLDELNDLQLERPDVASPPAEPEPVAEAPSPELPDAIEPPTIVEEAAAAEIPTPLPPVPTPATPSRKGRATAPKGSRAKTDKSKAEPKPKGRRGGRRRGEPGVEILDQTDPTFESALDLDDAVEAPAEDVGETIDTGAGLTDTTFGRAVDEFTGPSTGPIVEHVDDINLERSEIGAAAEEDVEPAVAEASATAPLAPSTRDLSQSVDATAKTLPTEDLVIPAWPGESDEAKTIEIEEAVSELPGALPDSAATAPTAAADDALNLDDLAELEEFVAVPEDEPVGDELTLEELEDLDQAIAAPAAPVAESPKVEAPRVEPPRVEPPPPVLQPAQAEAAPVVPPPLIQPTPQPRPAAETPAPSSVPAATPSKPGPSLFGFDFEGESFLGGMPLKLGTPSPAAPAAKTGKVDFTFEPQAPAPTGRGKTAAPPTPVPMSPEAVPPSIAANAPVTVDADALLDDMEAASRKPAPPRRPAPKGKSVPATPRSLTDLGSAAPSPSRTPQQQPLSTEPPVPAGIPSLAAEMSVPPLARASGAKTQARRPLTTAFDGLAGAGVRNTDVFSQMASPISATAFAARSGDSDDNNFAPAGAGGVDKTGDPLQPGRAGARPPGEDSPRGVGSIQRGSAAPPSARRMRVPSLIALMLVLAAGAWVMVHLYVPVYADVKGTLAFANLAAQRQAQQNEFRDRQVGFLKKDAQSDALQFVKAHNVDPGFLKDPFQYDPVINKAIGWTGAGGETLEISYLASDAEAGKAQVAALLEVLSQHNGGLGDAAQRAKREAADAREAVRQAQVQLDVWKKEIAEQRALGEDRPDPVELARLDTEVTRLGKQRESATAARAGAEEALNQLRLLDTTKPLDATSDPQLVDLRKQLQDVNRQITALKTSANAGDGAVASADGATTQPAAVADDSELLKQLQDQADSLNSKVNERLTAIQADQAISSDQRAVNRDKAVEDQSIRVKTLQDQERAATEAASVAVAKAREVHDRLDKSRVATGQIDTLVKEITAGEADLKAAADGQRDKDAAVAATISLDGDGHLTVTAIQRPDQRPIVAGAASGIIIVIFCLMILSAHRSAGQANANAVPKPVQPLPEGPAAGAAEAHRDIAAEQDEDPLPV